MDYIDCFQLILIISLLTDHTWYKPIRAPVMWATNTNPIQAALIRFQVTSSNQKCHQSFYSQEV